MQYQIDRAESYSRGIDEVMEHGGLDQQIIKKKQEIESRITSTVEEIERLSDLGSIHGTLWLKGDKYWMINVLEPYSATGAWEVMLPVDQPTNHNRIRKYIGKDPKDARAAIERHHEIKKLERHLPSIIAELSSLHRSMIHLLDMAGVMQNDQII